MIIARGDDKKLRLDWGIKSLPWLILTDQHHIIRTEGVSLTELTCGMASQQKQ